MVTQSSPLPPNAQACTCCDHVTNAQMEADQLLSEMWEYCPSRGCLWQICEYCKGYPRRHPIRVKA